MTKPTRRNWIATAGVAIALTAISPRAVEAGTTIGFGSSVGAINLTSSDASMHDGFVFQLGTFENGFIPTASNTDEWLGEWRAASDRGGEPLEGNTAPYSTRELGGPFPAGARVNSFSSSVMLDHNEPPFDLGGQLYIWGYDQRATPGAAEWILISDPSWIWPDGSSNLPAESYAVSSATTTVLGEIKGDGFEMKSAAVTVPESSAGFYEGWLVEHFSAEDRGNAELEASVWGERADPDKDGLTNLMEYFTGNDPKVAAAAGKVVLGDLTISDESITAEFRKSLTAVAVIGQVEWSADLKNWSRASIEQEVVGADDTHETVQMTWPMGELRRAYFRLAVERAP